MKMYKKISVKLFSTGGDKVSAIQMYGTRHKFRYSNKTKNQTQNQNQKIFCFVFIFLFLIFMGFRVL